MVVTVIGVFQSESGDVLCSSIKVGKNLSSWEAATLLCENAHITPDRLTALLFTYADGSVEDQDIGEVWEQWDTMSIGEQVELFPELI